MSMVVFPFSWRKEVCCIEVGVDILRGPLDREEGSIQAYTVIVLLL
jgi:hypothetical protein